jgi:hypothetical protein
MTEPVSQMEEWRVEFDKNSKLFAETFGTTSGKKVWAILDKYFNSQTIFDENPYKTARNAGRNEVVQYISAYLERSTKI